MSRTRHTTDDEPHFLVRTLASDYPDGHRLAPHAHPWGQLIYAVSGVSSVWTETGSWVIPPQWAVWAPAGVAHGLRFDGATSLRTLYLRPGLAGQPARSGVVPVSPLLRELVLRAVEHGMLDDREPLHRAMTALVLEELRERPTPSLNLPWPGSEALRQVAELVASAPDRRLPHAALARRACMSVRTLERGFLAETGLSLGRWARQARFLHALRRMGAGGSVKAAAIEAGYRTTSAFVAAFRAALGTTPGRYFDSGA